MFHTRPAINNTQTHALNNLYSMPCPFMFYDSFNFLKCWLPQCLVLFLFKKTKIIVQFNAYKDIAINL